jgi:hypothetical protein
VALITDKTERARYTFKSFLAVCPALTRNIQKWDIDPEDRHADVNCLLADGSRLDFQLVEWLEAEQTRQSVNREKAEKRVLGALLKQYPQPPTHLHSAVLEPKPEIRPPAAGDLAPMIGEFGDLIALVGEEWPRHPEWDGRQGYPCRDLKKWSTLAGQFWEVHFNLYAPDPDWIMFAMRGGAFEPTRALTALCAAVRKKLAHYGPPDAEVPIDLIVHYSRAAINNSPFHSLEIQEMEDVAKWLAQQLRQRGGHE